MKNIAVKCARKAVAMILTGGFPKKLQQKKKAGVLIKLQLSILSIYILQDYVCHFFQKSLKNGNFEIIFGSFSMA